MKKNYFRLIFLFLFWLLAACTKTPSTPEASPASQSDLPAALSYCSEDDSGFCLEGFGKEGEKHLLILFRDKAASLPAIEIQKEDEAASQVFACIQVEKFPQYFYCSGDFIQNGTAIQISAYDAQENLLAQGNFTIQQGDLSSLVGEIEIQGATQAQTGAAESASSPGEQSSPNYPNYPNEPDYPNQ